MKTLYSRFPCVLVEEMQCTQAQMYRIKASAFRASKSLAVSEAIEIDYAIDVPVNVAVKQTVKRLLDQVTL